MSSSDFPVINLVSSKSFVIFPQISYLFDCDFIHLRPLTVQDVLIYVYHSNWHGVANFNHELK